MAAHPRRQRPVGRIPLRQPVQGQRHAGAALGLVLYHAAFGFTSAWRVFIADRRGEGLRAQAGAQIAELRQQLQAATITAEQWFDYKMRERSNLQTASLS